MPQILDDETMLPMLQGYEEGPLNATPEATAIELLGVWPCRVESSRLDGRRLRTSALDYVKCVVLAGVVLVGALCKCQLAPRWLTVASRLGRQGGTEGVRAVEQREERAAEGTACQFGRR